MVRKHLFVPSSGRESSNRGLFIKGAVLREHEVSYLLCCSKLFFSPILIECRSVHPAFHLINSNICLHCLGYLLHFSAACQMILEPERHRENGMHSCIKIEVEFKNDYAIVSLFV